MTFVCPKCNYKDSPIWKPLFWKLYGSYADMTDFLKEHPLLAKTMLETGKAEDEHFIYEKHGKTRVMVHRFPKAFLMMRDSKLYEKTPSEKKFLSAGSSREESAGSQQK